MGKFFLYERASIPMQVFSKDLPFGHHPTAWGSLLKRRRRNSCLVHLLNSSGWERFSQTPLTPLFDAIINQLGKKNLMADFACQAQITQKVSSPSSSSSLPNGLLFCSSIQKRIEEILHKIWAIFNGAEYEYKPHWMAKKRVYFFCQSKELLIARNCEFN